MNDVIENTADDLAESTYQAAQGGDRRAFEAIVRHHQRPVRAWLAAHCPLGADVDELAQRTFVEALSRISEFNSGTNFGAWLFTIARYQLMTEVKRIHRLADYHSRLRPDLLARELERRAQQPDDQTTERLAHLRACLAALGESARQFLHWRYEDEISLEEMESRSGRSVPAIKKQLWLLRRKLQQCIEDKLAAESGGVA